MASSPPPKTDAPAGLEGDGAAGVFSKEASMSFLDHLEELRWSLFKGLGGIAVMVAACTIFRGWIIREVLLGPTKPDFFMYRAFSLDAQPIELLNRSITGQFFADIGTIVVVGIITGSPILLYYLWDFVEPALYPHEKEGLRFASAFATFFFMVGIAFGYCIITPLALQFFQSYQISGQIVNQFDISRYFSMVTFWALGTGLLFELPVAIYFLSKLGVVTADALRAYRKFALIIVLVLAAVFTPPDPVSQLLVALPLCLLYELSIYIAAYSERKARKRLEKLEREETRRKEKERREQGKA